MNRPAQFRIDTDAANRLLNEICSPASAYAPKPAKTAELLPAAVQDNKLEPDRLFTGILEGMDIAESAQPFGMNAEAPVFFAFSAMAPSIQVCAAQLSHYLRDLPARSQAARSYCPVCGSSPNLALFDESGRKHVSCSLCGYIRQVQRMGCLFCDATSKDSHHYFFTGEETEYRVYCCDECHHYIKTVDIREMGRGFFPKLEQIATLHLDMKARDQGYHAPGKNMHMM